MNQRHITLLNEFNTTRIGPEWKSSAVCYLSGLEAAELLWPLNELFRCNFDLINSIPYSTQFEHAANKALVERINGKTWRAKNPSPGVWRVLLERQIQSILLCVANEAANNRHVVPLPCDLPKQDKTDAIALFLQWGMKLPYPIKDRPAFDLTHESLPESLLKH